MFKKFPLFLVLFSSLFINLNAEVAIDLISCKVPLSEAKPDRSIAVLNEESMAKAMVDEEDRSGQATASENLHEIKPIAAKIVRRAAFDFGSGKIKVQVADVDTETHCILHTHYSEAIKVMLSEDLEQKGNGRLSKEIQKAAVAAAKILKNAALKHGATQFYGVATEAYRKASNGKELTDLYWKKLNIPVAIIVQEEEGKYGFFTLIQEKGLDPSKTVSLDIGGGSFQVTHLDKEGRVQVYMGPFGRASFKNAVIKHVKLQDPKNVHTPNPMSQQEWEASLKYLASVLPSMPDEFQNKLSCDEVQVVSISAHPKALHSEDSYNKNDLANLVERYLDKKDETLALEGHANPPFAVPELALMYGILQQLGSKQVSYMQTTNGCTSALLVQEELWGNFESFLRRNTFTNPIKIGLVTPFDH